MAKKGLDGQPLTVRLRAEEVAALTRIAAEEDRLVSEIHRKLIREALIARGALPASSPVPSSPGAPPPSRPRRTGTG